VLSFGSVFLQVPIGWLGDKLPKRPVMAWLAILTMVLIALLPVSTGTLWIWPVLLLAGGTSVGIYTIALAELGERFSGAELVAGTAAMSTTWGLGALIGAMLAGWAFQGYGPDGFPYSLAVVLAIFLALMWIRGRWKRSHGV
jgi:MFS family permease